MFCTKLKHVNRTIYLRYWTFSYDVESLHEKTVLILGDLDGIIR